MIKEVFENSYKFLNFFEQLTNLFSFGAEVDSYVMKESKIVLAGLFETYTIIFRCFFIVQ